MLIGVVHSLRRRRKRPRKLRKQKRPGSLVRLRTYVRYARVLRAQKLLPHCAAALSLPSRNTPRDEVLVEVHAQERRRRRV